MISPNSVMIFLGGSVLLFEGRLPSLQEAAPIPLTESGSMGALGPAGARWGRADLQTPLPPSWEAMDRRRFGEIFGLSDFKTLSAAWGLSDWHHQAQYCGCCGAKMEPAPGEHHGARCPRCGHMLFPVICPAMIVAVERDGKLLLARNIQKPTGRVSVLAGFLEAGESLEDAVVREVREEVGIEVDHVEYVSSQYWPFPRSLMLACRAQWKSGELAPDGTEIGQAAWYGPDEIPENIPGAVTVAGQLIQDFILRHRKQ